MSTLYQKGAFHIVLLYFDKPMTCFRTY